MCGIIGIVNSDSTSHVAQALVDGLTLLQHRGQDAAGIVTSSDQNRLNMRKDNGTVADVFTQQNIINLRGNIGIGHVRYPTAGGSCSAEAQPFYTNYPYGLALGHNGNLTNTKELLENMRQVHRHINTDSDSEVLLNVFADELQRRQGTGGSSISIMDIFDALRIVFRKCKGGYAVILLINGIGLLAFRDPNGIRPLCYGKRKSLTSKTGGYDYAIASESVAVDALTPAFKLERDILPGEGIFISMNGDLQSQIITTSSIPMSLSFTPCLFEYVYFARPDSILDGVKVYDARINMGAKLAKKILSLFPNHDIDSVIPIPETSRTAALQCANILNKPYREGYVKNRYIARTFIMPGQEARKKTVRLKLNTIRSEFEGKVVLLIDDSIVRGTTSIELIQMAREAGAKKVYFASAAPPVRYPNVYGIDIPTRQELVAHNRTEEQIQIEIGADKVIYNDLEDVIDAVRSLNPSKLNRFDDSCFSGNYITEDVTPQYLQALENSRGQGRTAARGSPNLFPSTENNNNKNSLISSAAPLSADQTQLKSTQSKPSRHPSQSSETSSNKSQTQQEGGNKPIISSEAIEIEMKSFSVTEEVEKHLYQPIPTSRHPPVHEFQEESSEVHETMIGNNNSANYSNQSNSSLSASVHSNPSVDQGKGSSCEMIYNQI